ncbi:MAG: discoidin domain-containing protein [Bacteroidota bacterium]
MKTSIFAIGLVSIVGLLHAQEWNGISVPANAGSGKTWQLQSAQSDDFNYVFTAKNFRSDFGPGNKWYNFYHNAWDGPGTTYWKYNHTSVDGDNLVLRASRWNQASESNPATQLPNKMGRPLDGVQAGCVTSNSRVGYPVFVEARVSVADIVLASDVWLLSADDTEEIDIIECYGGNEQGNQFFAEFIHLSHHSFDRTQIPIKDYQPRDINSWWPQNGVSDWGSYHWNGGNRRYVRIGVYWISPFHFEYYIDGQLQRVLYRDAVATRIRGTWYYEFPGMTNGQLNFDPVTGFQAMTRHASGGGYDFETLKEASDRSSTSIIDPFFFQGGFGMTEEMDIIINVESQDWHVAANRTPTDAQLNSAARNRMLVDWIRVYKPVSNAGGGGTDLALGRNSFQSSTYQNNTNSFGSGKAVDGNANSFNHTNAQQGAWWEVDLGSSRNIGSVRIWNRGDCCQNRLQNFDIKVSNTQGGTPTKSVFVAGSPSVNGTSYTVNGTGRWVRLQLRGNNFLHLDQVSIFSGNSGNARIASSQASEKVDKAAPFEDIRIYPNPARGKISLKGLVSGSNEIAISTLLGKQVLFKQIEVSGGTSVLDIHGLVPGTYILSVGQMRSKLIVK